MDLRPCCCQNKELGLGGNDNNRCSRKMEDLVEVPDSFESGYEYYT